jgi:hypothetical protein
MMRALRVVMRHFDRTTMRHFGSQMLASMEDFRPAVAVRVELSMTTPVRADDPYKRIAADEHDIPISHACNVDVARRGNISGLRSGRPDDNAWRRWRRLNRDDGGTRFCRRGGNLLLARDAAA